MDADADVAAAAHSVADEFKRLAVRMTVGGGLRDRAFEEEDRAREQQERGMLGGEEVDKLRGPPVEHKLKVVARRGVGQGKSRALR